MMRYMKEFYRFIKHVIESRKLLFTLAYHDFKSHYLGSYLGVFWVVLRPALFILVIWFVFSVGFKTKPVEEETPFVLWLLCGMIPWLFFAEALQKGMNAITSNAYLVKKVSFRISILPVVSILSALCVHFVLILLLVMVFILNGFYPTLYWMQLIYYVFLTFILLVGLSFFTSSLRVFIKDMGEIIGLVIQFGFWLTPIFWSFKIIPEQYHYFIKLNPMVYIVEGFRDTFIYQTWFWEKTGDTLQFLSITIFIFLFGAIIFKRLRPHFGDVL
ncbi:MAG: ABC transporter permease [Wolinella succinogenes]|nr:ABC transporter permease [Wolinella succinogenes]